MQCLGAHYLPSQPSQVCSRLGSSSITKENERLHAIVLSCTLLVHLSLSEPSPQTMAAGDRASSPGPLVVQLVLDTVVSFHPATCIPCRGPRPPLQSHPSTFWGVEEKTFYNCGVSRCSLFLFPNLATLKMKHWRSYVYSSPEYTQIGFCDT